jgi:hypothetical protein
MKSSHVVPNWAGLIWVKGTAKNPDCIPTAVLRKNFLLTYQTYAALQNFSRALHLGEL